MNRTILIVICDFLLVSLLAFSTVDINKVSEEGAERRVKVEIATNQVESGKDLTAVMRQALEEERKSRDQLLGELTKTRDSLGKQRALLSEHEQHYQTLQQTLQSRDQQLQTAQQTLQSRDQQLTTAQRTLQSRDQQLSTAQQTLQSREQQLTAAQQTLQSREKELATTRETLQSREQQLAAAQQSLQSREKQLETAQQTLRSRDQQLQTVQQNLQSRDQQAQQLQQEQASLQQRFAASQTNLQALNQQLRATSAEASGSKEKLATLEADIRKQVDQTAALQQRLAQLAASNQMVLNEKQQLANQLQVAEVERRHAAELAVRMQEQVKVEREEKARLAEGVKVLATNSVQLAREIRENRPLAPNAVFHEFLTNRVQASLYAVRSGFFGDATKSKDTDTVLVSNGTNTFALCHVQDTPLALYNPGTDWEGLTGTLVHDTAMVPVHSLAFHREDPRVVFMPVSAAEARKLGCKVYRVATDPFKFQDAVLVGAREGYYGECRFQIDPTTPEYVKLDHNFVKGLFGKFNPSRGDLVFSKNGELLGVMANSAYCLMLRDFRASASLQFGQDIRPQRTGIVLSTLYARVFNFPYKLQ